MDIETKKTTKHILKDNGFIATEIYDILLLRQGTVMSKAGGSDLKKVTKDLIRQIDDLITELEKTKHQIKKEK